jgi:hypothetical protein
MLSIESLQYELTRSDIEDRQLTGISTSVIHWSCWYYHLLEFDPVRNCDFILEILLASHWYKDHLDTTKLSILPLTTLQSCEIPIHHLKDLICISMVERLFR